MLRVFVGFGRQINALGLFHYSMATVGDVSFDLFA